MVYDTARRFFTREGEKNPDAFGKLAAGAASGAIAQTATYPLLVSPLMRLLSHALADCS